MKKKMLFTLLLTVCLATAGCGSQPASGSEPSTEVSVSSEVSEEASSEVVETTEISEESEESSVEVVEVGTTYESNGDGTHKVDTIGADGSEEHLLAELCEYDENNTCIYCGYVLEQEETEESTVAEKPADPKQKEEKKQEENKPSKEEIPTKPSEETPVNPPAPTTPPATPPETPVNPPEQPVTPPETPGEEEPEEEWTIVKDVLTRTDNEHIRTIGWREIWTGAYKEEVTSAPHSWVKGPVELHHDAEGNEQYYAVWICSECGHHGKAVSE